MASQLKASVKLERELAELAHIRTDLSRERTVLSYIRTATSLILFGIAFIGFQKQYHWFIYVGWASVLFGVLCLAVSVHRAMIHRKRHRWLKSLFGRI